MENNKNMTAVEWLIERLEINNSVSRQGEFWNLLKNQAKQMEKEQIINAFGEKRQFMGFGDDDEFWITDMTAEQYYNETYGQENSN